MNHCSGAHPRWISGHSPPMPLRLLVYTASLSLDSARGMKPWPMPPMRGCLSKTSSTHPLFTHFMPVNYRSSRKDGYGISNPHKNLSKIEGQPFSDRFFAHLGKIRRSNQTDLVCSRGIAILSSPSYLFSMF